MHHQISSICRCINTSVKNRKIIFLTFSFGYMSSSIEVMVWELLIPLRFISCSEVQQPMEGYSLPTTCWPHIHFSKDKVDEHSASIGWHIVSYFPQLFPTFVGWDYNNKSLVTKFVMMLIRHLHTIQWPKVFSPTEDGISTAFILLFYKTGV